MEGAKGDRHQVPADTPVIAVYGCTNFDGEEGPMGNYHNDVQQPLLVEPPEDGLTFSHPTDTAPKVAGLNKADSTDNPYKFRAPPNVSHDKIKWATQRPLGTVLTSPLAARFPVAFHLLLDTVQEDCNRRGHRLQDLASDKDELYGLHATPVRFERVTVNDQNEDATAVHTQDLVPLRAAVQLQHHFNAGAPFTFLPDDVWDAVASTFQALGGTTEHHVGLVP